MAKITLWILIFFLTHISITVANTTLSGPIKQLVSDIEKLIKTKKIPGCAVAIVYHDNIIYINTFGVRKMGPRGNGQNEPITRDTLFQLGSISKPITATLVAILHKQGIIDIDQVIKERLPWLHEETTTRHLLSHTSGYNRSGWNSKIEQNTPRIRLLHDLSAHPQNIPGETFDYHNMAFSLLEDVLALQTNQPFRNLLKSYVFNPVGMMGANVGRVPFEIAKNKAWPHQITKKGKLIACASFSKFYHELVPSAGGVNATINDMANFLLLQLNGHSNIIDANDLQAFHTPVIPTKNELNWFKKDAAGAELKVWYGLGWRILDIDQQRIVYHGGWLKGFKNFMAFLPDRKLGIVILHNSERSFSKEAGIKFLRAASQML